MSKDRGLRGGKRQRSQNLEGQSLREAYSLCQVAHLGEAASEVPQAAVEGHPLGGLTVLGELQGGSKLMTRRPQAAMLRFIWEALRKFWPRGGRWCSVPAFPKVSPALSSHSLFPPHLSA